MTFRSGLKIIDQIDVEIIIYQDINNIHPCRFL
jgi:hypothetical protein